MNERRRDYRLSKVLAAELQGETHQDSRLFVIDISLSGLRATAQNRLPHGREIDIVVSLTGNHGSIAARAEIVWQRELALLSMFQMGLRFVDMSEAAASRLRSFIEAERSEREAHLPDAEGLGALRNLSYESGNRLAVLREVQEKLSSARSLDDVLQRLLNIMVEATGAQRGFVMLDRGGELPEVAVAGGEQPKGSEDGAFLFSRSVVEKVLRHGDSVLSLDAGRDENLSASESLKFMKTRFVLCVPLRSGQNCFGLVYVDSTAAGATFSQSDLELAKLIAGMGAAAAERVQLAPSLGAALHWDCLVWLAGLATQRMVENPGSDSQAAQDLLRLLEESPLSPSAGYLLKECVAQVGPALKGLGQQISIEFEEDLVPLEVELELHSVVLASLLWLAFLTETTGAIKITASHEDRRWITIQMTHPEVDHPPLPTFPVSVSPGSEGGAIIRWWVESHGGTMKISSNELLVRWPVVRARGLAFTRKRADLPRRLEI